MSLKSLFFKCHQCIWSVFLKQLYQPTTPLPCPPWWAQGDETSSPLDPGETPTTPVRCWGKVVVGELHPFSSPPPQNPTSPKATCNLHQDHGQLEQYALTTPNSFRANIFILPTTTTTTTTFLFLTPTPGKPAPCPGPGRPLSAPAAQRPSKNLTRQEQGPDGGRGGPADAGLTLSRCPPLSHHHRRRRPPPPPLLPVPLGFPPVVPAPFSPRTKGSGLPQTPARPVQTRLLRDRRRRAGPRSAPARPGLPLGGGGGGGGKRDTPPSSPQQIHCREGGEVGHCPPCCGEGSGGVVTAGRPRPERREEAGAGPHGFPSLPRVEAGCVRPFPPQAPRHGGGKPKRLPPPPYFRSPNFCWAPSRSRAPPPGKGDREPPPPPGGGGRAWLKFAAGSGSTPHTPRRLSLGPGKLCRQHRGQ